MIGTMGISSHANLFFVLFMLSFYVLDVGIATESITSSQSIKDSETLSSKDGNFTFGFFTPPNSSDRYVGIWWKSQSTVLWVANRNQSLNDSSGVVTFSEDGNLVVLNGQNQVIWSTSVSNISTDTTAQLSDEGKLKLTETTTGNSLWDSFQQPSNTLLPQMKVSSNRTGRGVGLTSWKNPSDPSVGSFSLGAVERGKIVQVFIWNETRPYWRSGPWSGGVFTGVDLMASAYLNSLTVVDGEVTYNPESGSEFGIFVLNSQGQVEQKYWDDEQKALEVSWTSKLSDCDVYGVCGSFAICDAQSQGTNGSPICSCLKGFEPNNKEEWDAQNWTSGCFRSTPLQCERAKDQNTTIDTNADQFLELQKVKVPDFSEWSSAEPETCRSQCLQNCSCVAYSHDDGIGCMSWNDNLLDLQQLSNRGLHLYVRVDPSQLQHGKKTTIIITVTVIIGIVIIVTCACVIWRRTSCRPAMKRGKKGFLCFKNDEPLKETGNKVFEELSRVKLQELLLFDFEKLATATNNFHQSNKLGQGGFGPVYMGKLQDGQEIAVKRLSRASGQGLEEFMNEVIVISKLQHRNLVRLLGCCIEGDEKMLLYEYMPNKSLDVFIFDPKKHKLLDWRKRCSIIEGIARGLLYLHRDSRLKIIHRDLKASNILLDDELNPKISDFGMARIFGRTEDHANTNRIVGTYGYISPEYAMQGLFSEKSDVFSFGVLLLEIVSGRRNTSFYDDEHSLTLLGFTWAQWKEGNMLSLVDSEIYDPNDHEDMLRVIHIGLLCVQELASDRPTMATVVSMLNSDVVFLPPPSQPAFIRVQNVVNSESAEESQRVCSVNTISITKIYGR
ncbi:G-type lectin S-receptor-like serine/threonine-protein kinase At1g11300 [Vigna radiata var. radiata]|uniref:Receptor-like serine/threonine-protein kinase n=1 Tax=Vigna radiata var. radiata TaxID=3916 RepID=A0A3Q0EWF0_VIGRR|nr:G-type lectin S-receptor-like serine/threonine-protein kinase At1g11300 [Vigna radiata var. radiata]